MSWLMVLFWSSLVVKVSSNYHVVEDTTYTPCTLATPKIEFGELNNTFMLDDNLLDTGQKAQIGYVEALVKLQYIGCIRLSGINGINHVNVSTSLDVGQCYSACGDDYAIIGLTSREEGDVCLCFGNDIKTKNRNLDKCDVKCGSFVCGSEKHISLYEKVNIDQNRYNDGSEGCLGIAVNWYGYVYGYQYGYTWFDCDKTLTYTACVTDTDDIDPPGLISYEQYGGWFDGVKRCFKQEQCPMPFRNSVSTTWNWKSYNLWTGVVQTIAIRNGQDYASNSVKAYGYVVKSNYGEYFLVFDESRDKTSRSICIDEMVSSSTESSSTSPSSSTGVDTTSPLRSTQTSTSTSIAPENTSIADTSAANLITTPMTKMTTAMSTENQHMTESMGSPNGDKTEEESNVGLSIGLPVAALLLVGIGVVVFVLWKRRRKPLKEREAPSSLQDNVIYQNNNAMIAQTNNAYEEADKPSDVPNDQANVYDLCKDDDKNSQHDYGNSYFVLEKAKDGEEYSEVSKAREKKSEYSEVSKTRDKKTESNDNAYFVLEKEEKTPDPEDTGYGSSNSGNFKSKGASNVPDRHVYSTAGSANTVGNPNDEYDHIGRSSGRALTESNNYDTTFAQKQERNPDENYYSRSHPSPLRSEGARNLPDGHVYNTAGSANADGNTNDEYDHIGRTSGRALTESNLYDSTFENKPTDTTYDSTLLNTSANRNKTDAIYDKANNAANNVYANICDI